MRLVVVGIGRSSKGPERELVDRYLKRIPKLARAQGFSDIALLQLAESRKDTASARKKDEAQAILDKTGDATFIVFDERGDILTSEDFACLLRDRRGENRGDLCFVLGGPDGIDETLRKKARAVLAFGRMTWPHQLALSLAMEQIYRGLTVLGGHPYHRA